MKKALFLLVIVLAFALAAEGCHRRHHDDRYDDGSYQGERQHRTSGDRGNSPY